MITDEQLLPFVNYDFDKNCKSEEDVKIKFVVKLLEAFGHNIENIHFEAKGSDILIDYGSESQRIVVEIKHHIKKLDNFKAQLVRYWRKHKSIIAILCNGKELWIFHPWKKKNQTTDTCLFRITNKELIQKKDILINLLSRNSIMTGNVAKYMQDIESRTIECVEMLDYVNYYGLIRGNQIMVCTKRKHGNKLILMCKKEKEPTKHDLSEAGKDFLKKLPEFKYSNYVADVEIIQVKRNKYEMWEKLSQEHLFHYWDPKKGPYKFNRKIRKSIALCRVYNIDVKITENDISGGQTNRKLINRMKINDIREALLTRTPVIDDETYRTKYDKIRAVIANYV